MAALNIREQLAVERTILANERTFLSYLRTGLTMAALGVTALKFLNNWFFIFAGWLTIGAAVVILLVGIKRYLWVTHVVEEVENGSKVDLNREGYWPRRYLIVLLKKFHFA